MKIVRNLLLLIVISANKILMFNFKALISLINLVRNYFYSFYFILIYINFFEELKMINIEKQNKEKQSSQQFNLISENKVDIADKLKSNKMNKRIILKNEVSK